MKKLIGKNLEITYEITGGIPFRWEYEIKNKKIVEFVKNYVVKDYNEEGALTGAPVIINYVFKGLKEGETIITFKLVNFADNYVTTKEKYKVKVDKDLNVILIEE